MNIIYIDHYAGSRKMGMEFRPFYLAEEWQKMGHKVRIIAADYSHLRKDNPTISRDFEVTETEGIEYQWIKTKKYEGNGASRAITMLQFCGKLWLQAGRIAMEFKPNAVIASSTYPLDTFPAHKIKRKAKAVLVHEVHDMWPITPIELYGMSKYNPFVVAMQIGENFFCKHSDLIVSILPCTEEYFKKHGLKSGKFAYIPNGIIEDDWNNPEELPEQYSEAIENAQKEGKLVIAFFGSHTKSYCIDYLLKAVANNPDLDVYLMFVGSGNYKEDLMKMAEELGLDDSRCGFFPPVSKKMIPSLLKKIDVSYIGAKKNNMFRFGVGMNKLYDSMMGGKPILYAVEAPYNEVEKYHCGVTVKAESESSIADGIKKLLSMTPEERNTMGENGKTAVLKNNIYPKLAEKFIQEIGEREYSKHIKAYKHKTITIL